MDAQHIPEYEQFAHLTKSFLRARAALFGGDADITEEKFLKMLMREFGSGSFATDKALAQATEIETILGALRSKK